MSRLWIDMGMLSFFATPVMADVSGRTQWTGREISYSGSGGQNASSSANSTPDQYDLKITVDQDVHNITITPDQLQWNGKVARLGEFKKLVIQVKGKSASFEVDGKKLVP